MINLPGLSHRAALHYLSATVILSLYGVQVCPFLDTLSVPQLLIPLLVALGLQFLLRRPCHAWLTADAPYEHQVERVFAVELGLFLVSGLLLATFNALYYQFPVDSGLKVFMGFAMLGFFASLDLMLERQRELVEHVYRTGEHLKVRDNYIRLSEKLGLFAFVSVLFILGVVFLVISKDLVWLSEVGRTVSYEQAQMLILGEVAFVVGVILIHVLNTIYSYVRNLKGFLDHQTGVLSQAAGGDLNGFVPVGTNDEFGVMAVHTNEMVKGLRESTEEIRRTRDVSILTLASLAETRDNETGAHILRTQRYVRALAEHLQNHPRFSRVLTDENIELLYKSAPLHDIGKVGIPDHILLKPGRLTREEFDIMKTHPLLGAQALNVSERELGSCSFLHFAREISISHHEKWDGSGYPFGLKGDSIPVSGRLMALADVYDALISERVYKSAFSHEEARDLLVDGRGKHFDPDVVDAFLDIEGRFMAIAEEFSDGAENLSGAFAPGPQRAIA